ncbi:hypothetical protein PFICI_01585 [Pestalotiopsis fici W106-1]|uniref:F-box domain-containing protein n=1 Tax=Pestalotiopsis fici (strain W106-1 / CGMCC3.15140) TaxID=1229662 RepID=W3XQH4_PESFW|nr:uncharacterized protein PFICI_01585 [Pestalotiopsis fici W106-1]ETS87757.1 hypothetical protein PFICI_01585 [Pestalotiopsis fici W106-1]
MFKHPMPTCQLCGIGFETGRIRTPAEPRGAGWHSRGPASLGDLRGFLQGDGDFGSPTLSHMADGRDRLCPPSAGCMVDKRWKKGTELLDAPGLVDNFFDREVEPGPQGDYYDAYVSESSEEDDPYEYDSNYESDSESSVTYQSDADTPSVLANTKSSASPIRSDSPATVHSQALIPVRDKVMVNYEYEDFNYEHISGGPNCQWRVDRRLVFNGHFISADEMRGCNTVQCFVAKSDNWVPEPDDQKFEISGRFFLSGLGYQWARQGNWRASVCPPRHDIEDVKAINNFHMSEGPGVPCLPFHPTCLEVFKRVSTQRSGAIDYEGLFAWWFIASGEVYDNFPRDPAAIRARSYQDKPGDEFVVANPCFMTKLASIVASSDRSDEPSFGHNTTVFRAARKAAGDMFASLPRELLLIILDPLGSKDIANLRLASRSFHQLPQSVFRTLTLRELPWLWEAWSSMEYSKWAYHKPSELLPTYERREIRDEFLSRAETVLAEEARAVQDPEPYHAAISALREENAKEEEALKNYPESPAPLQLHEKTDWYHLRCELARNHSTLLGLRNRRRIWKDCEEILNQIDGHRADAERYRQEVEDGAHPDDFLMSDDEEDGSDDDEEW